MHLRMLRTLRSVPVQKKVRYWEGLVPCSCRYPCAPRRKRLPRSVQDAYAGAKGSGFWADETAPGGVDIRQISVQEICQEALGLLAVPGSQERAEGKLMIDENC